MGIGARWVGEPLRRAFLHAGTLNVHAVWRRMRSEVPVDQGGSVSIAQGATMQMLRRKQRDETHADDRHQRNRAADARLHSFIPVASSSAHTESTG